jgi:NAD(P)-dependent dehydrogenase (short-subunit alcohol dehydrogenase family)
MKNQSVLITGASAGLGCALAFSLARRGAKVALVARGEEALAAVVRGIRAEGGTALALPFDVADKAAVHRIVGQAAAAHGAIDLLINNASTLGAVPLRHLADTDCEDLSHAFAVNLIAPFRLTKAVVGHMVLAGRGTIVNISSDAATEAYAGWGAYAASKAALDQLTRVWAAELAGSGVRLVSADPGEMDTAMHADAMPDADRDTLARPDIVAEGLLTALLDAASGSRIRVQS